ncbi:hypothetical protein GGR55DRAFT_692269 [Xylaria sp. FL0064]|nr:hypothetical protein GGR55DRAFT_692269 [Xylaria sp. FL0064]
MSSISLGKRQWNSTWDCLPIETRLLIFEALMQDGCTLSRLATVSREWQAEFERYNFVRIILTPSRLVYFSAMIHRSRYIWFCLELDDYDCTRCAPIDRSLIVDDEVLEASIVSDTDHCPNHGIRGSLLALDTPIRFPRLQEVHYEPWREWCCHQKHTDRHYQYLFESIQRSNSHLKGLVVFENFNQHRAVALASFKLEHLAASFIVDASHFFEVEPSWEWPNLTSLGLAALFKYQAFCNIEKAIITWRGTWKLTMEPSVIQAWEAVIDEAAIKSNGDVIHFLMLSSQVIRPISLQQIQIE